MFLHSENEQSELKSSTKLLIISQSLPTMKFVFLTMLSIVLIGTGNVAHHLFDAFLLQQGVLVKQVYGRNKQSLEYFSKNCKVTSNANAIEEADLFIIAVNDDAIFEVSTILKDKKGIVAHTSGTVAIENISNTRSGVFYPLQTFTKNKKLDFSNIPICIEANNKKDLKVIGQLAKSISTQVHEVSSAQREKLHLAAVFVNNFTNHMYSIGHEICRKDGIPFGILKPLMEETIAKLEFLSPKKTQTGPAKRNDLLTMQKHLAAIDNPLHKKIYQLISESIKEENEEKL